SRKELFDESLKGRMIVFHQIPQLLADLPPEDHQRVGKLLGLALGDGRRFEVHVLRIAYHVRQNGATVTQVALEVTQSTQRYIDEGSPKPSKPFWFRGGSTLIIDLDNQAIRYAIVKDATDPERFEAQRKYLNEGTKGLAYFRNQQMASGSEPFWLL